MNIIRYPSQDHMTAPCFTMIPLLVQWGVKRCNIKNCKNSPTTIIAGTDAPVFGMCEHHYQEAVAFEGEYKMELEF